MYVISNGKLSSAKHRVVTNENASRLTVTSFINPSDDCPIEPAKGLLVKDCSPPLYKAFTFKFFA